MKEKLAEGKQEDELIALENEYQEKLGSLGSYVDSKNGVQNGNGSHKLLELGRNGGDYGLHKEKETIYKVKSKLNCLNIQYSL